MRGTVFLMENYITMRITEQHERMEVITQELYVPNCIAKVLYTPVSILSCPGKMCSLVASFERWYFRKSMASETHTVKQALHSPFTYYATGIVIQLFATRGLLATDHVILNHGQVTWTTPELASPLLTTTPHQREDISALDRVNVHRCPTRRVFSGTGLELVTRQSTVRYVYHSATAATNRFQSTPKHYASSSMFDSR
ncbi:uncharacterized protein TNCV_3291191 [Trichonephila clavipes]|nr:uncharacterized protein TNCV_3291191 [Trichonephila clavipes]